MELLAPSTKRGWFLHGQIGKQEIEQAVDVVAIHSERAIHIGFAEMEIRVQEQFPGKVTGLKANDDGRSPLITVINSAPIWIDNRQGAVVDKLA